MTSNDPQTIPKDVNENDKFVSRKMRAKTNLKGGFPSDNPTQGSALMEQAFSSI